MVDDAPQRSRLDVFGRRNAPTQGCVSSVHGTVMYYASHGLILHQASLPMTPVTNGIAQVGVENVYVVPALTGAQFSGWCLP